MTAPWSVCSRAGCCAWGWTPAFPRLKRWTRAVKPAQRIGYTLRAYELAQGWDWCQAVVLWAFRYPWAAQSYLDYFTFVTPDFEPKPIYLEVQKYARGDEK